jgi:hypothetical protein
MGQTSDCPDPDASLAPVTTKEFPVTELVLPSAADTPAGGPARRWWPVVAAVAVLAAGLSLLSPSARHQWALSVFRQPDRYTALSFSNPAKLPAAAFWNQPIRIAFSVSNQEGRLTTYRYVMSESADGRTSTLGGSSRTIAAGTRWNISTIVRPTCTTSPCQVRISLPGHPETIDFNVNLQPGG